jgi:hypothetical protein
MARIPSTISRDNPPAVVLEAAVFEPRRELATDWAMATLTRIIIAVATIISIRI